MCQGLQRSLAERDCLRVRGPTDRLGAGLMPVQRRFVPDFTLSVVHAEGFEVRLEILRVYLLESPSNTQVKKLAVRRQDSLAGDLADPIVSKVKPLSKTVEDTTTHQFLNAPCRLACTDASGCLQYREFEFSPDQRSHADEFPTEIAQPGELTNTSRRRPDRQPFG